MKQIIINADDFGINETVTKEIERMAEAGAITSTTIMANGQCLDETKRFSLVHPEISYGVHLCLSEFDSLTKSSGLKQAGLVDDEGHFITKAVFQNRNLNNPIVQQSIRDELNAQIDVVSSLGVPISHVDSHHHVHTIYPLMDLFTQVLHNRGIKRIRLGGSFRTLRMKAHIVQWIKRNKLNCFYHNAFITTDSFYSYAEFLNAGCPIKEDETIELMCHPGHPSVKYQNEIKILEQALLPKEVKTISYNELY